MWCFNHLHPPFDNPKLRRALLPALDQASYLSAVVGDQAEFKRVGVGVFPPGTPLANTAGLDALTSPRDLALARKLVKESGYNGERIVLLGPTDYPTIGAVATMTEALFKDVGLNVDFVATDFGTMISRRASQESVEKGGWSTFCTAALGYQVANPISNNMIRGLGKEGWFGWPTSPHLQALRNAWLDAPDVQAQQTVAADIQRTVFDEVPYIPTGQWFNPSAWRRQRDRDRQRCFSGVLEPKETLKGALHRKGAEEEPVHSDRLMVAGPRLRGSKSAVMGCAGHWAPGSS